MNSQSFQRLALASLVVCLLVGTMLIDETSAGCYDDWSRCSPVSKWLGGILWKKCKDRCKQLGHSGGECRPSPSKCWWLPNNQQCFCT